LIRRLTANRYNLLGISTVTPRGWNIALHAIVLAIAIAFILLFSQPIIITMVERMPMFMHVMHMEMPRLSSLGFRVAA
jgi:hypothetical protein